MPIADIVDEDRLSLTPLLACATGIVAHGVLLASSIHRAGSTLADLLYEVKAVP